MRAAVVIFPGSNCDRDVIWALEDTLHIPVDPVWHDETSFPTPPDLVVLPGGFSYGDYLRSGAMAARSPLMGAVKAHAEAGGLLLGICNGFQVLTEARLLPGALLPNTCQTFLCRPCHLRVERVDTPFTGRYAPGQVVQFPIAHHEGLFFLPEAELDELERRGQVVFRYATPEGVVGPEASPNGSLRAIAGIVNGRGNVLGLMPHPERASEALLGGADGREMWHSVSDWVRTQGDGRFGHEGA